MSIDGSRWPYHAVLEESFQECLFAAPELTLDREHEVILEYGGLSGMWVDLDFVVVTVSEGDSEYVS